MNGNYTAKIIDSNNYLTKEFVDVFEVPSCLLKDEKEIGSNNIMNLFPAFSDYDIVKILASFDGGTPCIVGNCDLFDDYKVLKDYCVLKSDDDISELAQKINDVIANKIIILEEYKKFRGSYTNKVKATNQQFINGRHCK